MKKKQPQAEWQLLVNYMENENFQPYSYQQFEQAFWHLWTLNCYHVTLSFDVNMTLLLDWGICYHMGVKR